MAEVLEGEFKGNVIMIIRRGAEDKFPFQFGVKKAKLILEHLDEIRKFVHKHAA